MPNQSADSVMACDRASVSAPEGVKRATHFMLCGTIPLSSVSAPRPAKTNHNRFAIASTISAFNVPISYMLIVDGAGYNRRGVAGSYIADAAVSLVTSLMLMALLLWLNRRRPVEVVQSAAVA